MTFPSKENLIYFEELAKKQLPLFKDACDYGIKIGRHADTPFRVKDEARENLMALMQVYKYKLTRPNTARHPYDTDFATCSKTELFIPFEREEGFYIGVKLTVHFDTYTGYHAFNNEYTETLTIDITRHAQKESGYRPMETKSKADKWAENAKDAKRFH